MIVVVGTKFAFIGSVSTLLFIRSVSTMHDLSNVSTKVLLTELFNRFEEGVFIGHADDEVHPIHIACHFPNKSTNMHAMLASALERILTSIRRKYPTASVPAADHGMLVGGV